MLKYSLPLVPNSLSWTIIALTDRLLIINYLTEGQNGVYSVANRFPTIINTCYGYFNLSWKESASKALNNKDKDEFYNSVYKSLQHFLICVSILIIAALPFVFNLLIKNEFREAYYYIPILVISYKDTKILAQTTVVSTILNLVLGFLFIRYIGLYATALATGISYVIIYIYRNIKLRKYLVLKKDNFLLTSFLILIFVCLLYYIKNYILCGIGLLVAILYSYYINKSFIDVFINKFRRKA